MQQSTDERVTHILLQIGGETFSFEIIKLAKLVFEPFIMHECIDRSVMKREQKLFVRIVMA
jgi:hypothetical protein